MKNFLVCSFVLFEFVISQNIIKNYRFQVSPEAKQKKIGCKTLFCFGFAKTNFQIQNQNISFSPRGAWQTVAKWDFGARSAPAEAQRAEAISPQNAEIVNWRYLLVEILTFFEQNPD
jgi:hypothetical protein